MFGMRSQGTKENTKRRTNLVVSFTFVRALITASPAQHRPHIEGGFRKESDGMVNAPDGLERGRSEKFITASDSQTSRSRRAYTSLIKLR